MPMPYKHAHGRRFLTRRATVAVLVGGGVTLLRRGTATRRMTAEGAAHIPACVVRPQQTEGPYFVDERLKRSDIRANPADGMVQPGVPLQLTFTVSRLSGGACTPLAGVQVDLWQCNALGIYSDVNDPAFSTVGQKFLRGYQVTDTTGRAQFVTIYPGWYPGRTVHQHFKIRTTPLLQRGYAFTSQLYFDDALTDRLHTLTPYARKGPRLVRNNDDALFTKGGEQLVLPLTEHGEGYAATFAIGLQLG